MAGVASTALAQHTALHFAPVTMNLPAMHRALVLLLTTLWAGVCLALPAPHDIEQAAAKGQWPQAERMLREVIAEKPGSARAHYELAQVLAREGQHAQALQAIRTARELDPALKFAQSPEKFNAVARAIEQQASPDGAQRPTAAAALQPATPTTPAPSRPAWLWPAWLSAGFALLVLVLWRRSRSSLSAQTAMDQACAPPASRGFGAQFDPRGPAASYGNAPYPSPASGSGVTGAVVGGLAGVAAGYALSKALESHDHPDSSNSPIQPAASGRSTDPMEDVGLVRLDPSAPDSGLGRFDSGTGDDWESPAADDDSW